RPGKSMTVVLNPSTMLIGSPALVKAALRRSAGSVPSTSPLAARIEGLRSRYDLWAFGDGLDPAKMASSGIDGLQSGDCCTFGAGVTRGLEIAGEVHTRSAADVEKLTALLRGWEAMARSSAGPDVPAAKMDIQTADGTVRVAISVPEEEWQ